MTSLQICVVNKSTLVSDTDVKAMARVCNRQARDHIAPAWGMDPPVVRYIDDEAAAPAGAWVIAVLDNDDQAGALGWHSKEGSQVFGRVFAAPCLEAGSTAFSGAYAISVVLSHEVAEAMVDPAINAWRDTWRGYLIALEVCDPVQADIYTLHDRWRGDLAVSNFVLPAWFDPQATGKVDYLGRAAGPLHMTPGGYWVQAPIGSEGWKWARLREWEQAVGFEVVHRPEGDVVFSSEVPEWVRVMKLDPLGRGARKSRHPEG